MDTLSRHTALQTLDAGLGVTLTDAGNDGSFVAAMKFGANSKSIAGGAGDTTLTAAEADCGLLTVTGAITGNRTVTMPATAGRVWVVRNSTSGAYTVTFRVGVLTGIVVATDKVAILYCDGTDIVRATADLS